MEQKIKDVSYSFEEKKTVIIYENNRKETYKGLMAKKVFDSLNKTQDEGKDK